MHPEGTESTRLYEFLAWLEVNRRRVLFGAAAILGLVVVMYVYDWMAQQTERRANAAVLSVETGAAQNPEESASGNDEYLRVAREYPSTGAGRRALLLSATSLFSSGQYDAAQVQFEDFLRKHGKHPMAGSAALGVAACLDAQDKTDAALGGYQRFIDDYPTDAFVPRAKLAMAAIHEARSQPREALDLYDELAKPQIYGAAAMEAMTRREQLLEKHPELAPTNAPPAQIELTEAVAVSTNATNAADGDAVPSNDMPTEEPEPVETDGAEEAKE